MNYRRKKKRVQVKLSHGTCAEVGRRMTERTGELITAKRAWDRIHLSVDPEYIEMAAQIEEEKKKFIQRMNRRLADAVR